MQNTTAPPPFEDNTVWECAVARTVQSTINSVAPVVVLERWGSALSATR